jgi:hypothetical protein
LNKTKKHQTRMTDINTRAAVETSIDLSKDDKDATWEETAHRFPPRVKKWEDDADQATDKVAEPVAARQLKRCR